MTEEAKDVALAERQRIRAILWGLPMEGVEISAQREIARFVARADELISQIKPLPPELVVKAREWQAAGERQKNATAGHG